MTTTAEFSVAHMLLATEGIALMRSWCVDDGNRSAQLIHEVADICQAIDEPPYAETMHVVPRSVVAGYSQWAATYDKDNRSNPLIPLEAAALNEILAPVGGGRALDAACGTGRQTSRLLELGYDVTGLDATSAMLNVARHNHPTATYLEGDVRDMPLPGSERISSGDLAGLQDVDGFGDLPGAPGAAAEFAQDGPGLELGVGALAGGAELGVGGVG